MPSSALLGDHLSASIKATTSDDRYAKLSRNCEPATGFVHQGQYCQLQQGFRALVLGTRTTCSEGLRRDPLALNAPRAGLQIESKSPLGGRLRLPSTRHSHSTPVLLKWGSLASASAADCSAVAWRRCGTGTASHDSASLALEVPAETSIPSVLRKDLRNLASSTAASRSCTKSMKRQKTALSGGRPGQLPQTGAAMHPQPRRPTSATRESNPKHTRRCVILSRVLAERHARCGFRSKKQWALSRALLRALSTDMQSPGLPAKCCTKVLITRTIS